MKKLFLSILVTILFVNIIQSKVYIPRDKKIVKYTKFLKAKLNTNLKFNNKGHALIIKNKILKANDGGQLYGIDSISYLDGEGNHGAYEKYYFNNQGNLILTEFFILWYYEEGGETVEFYYDNPDQYSIYEYDGNDNLISFEQYSWNDDSEGYVGDYMGIYEYNLNDENTKYEEYIWDYINGEWIADYAEENTYNDEGNVSASNYYSWIAFDDDWEIFGKKEHYYDTLNNNTHSVEYAINDTGWMLAYYDTSIYKNENLINKLTYEYNKTDSSWTEISNNTWTYEDDINTKKIFKYYDIEEDTWQGSKIESIYDDDGFLIREKNYEWIPEEENWYLYSILDIFWDDIQNLILSAPKIITNIEINIYPNPFTDYLTISNSGAYNIYPIEYTIYNSIGNKINYGLLTSQKQQINLSNLHNGIYFLQVKMNPDKIIVKKILKN